MAAASAIEQVSHYPALRPAPELCADCTFEELAALVLRTVAPSSARVYDQTFRAWLLYAERTGIDPLAIRPAGILDFLHAQNVTKSTRQRQLSAFRKLAQMAYTLNGSEAARRLYEGLKIIRVNGVTEAGTPSGSERQHVALNPQDAGRVLNAWNGASNTDTRNAALIAVLALTGLRRSEAAALRWRDVDFDNGVISVRHGKGDKRRSVPMAGERALEALKALQMAQPAGYQYVFTPVERGAKWGADRSITGTDVYRIVKATEALTGVVFSPHDLRRTFITEALATGTPLPIAQAVAGHANGQTTLRYAQAVDARRARKELRLRYGS